MSIFLSILAALFVWFIVVPFCIGVYRGFRDAWRYHRGRRL